MKRFAAVLALLLLAGIQLTTANASRHASGTIICSRTTSSTAPYKKMAVSGKLLRAHLKKAADIIPAPKGACPKTVLSPTTGGTAFAISMTGEAESPAGDPVATGNASVRLRSGQGQVCYQITAKNLPTAAAAHLHSGAAGASGPVVVPFATPDASGASSGCASANRALVAKVLKTPASYYVNVHTAEFPAGAIRGQLVGTADSAFGWIASINLVGSSEPNAKGTAVVRIRQSSNQVCYRLTAQSITLPAVAAHIHRGLST